MNKIKIKITGRREWDQYKKLKQVIPLLALSFVFFSCADLQTPQNDSAQEKASQIEMSTGDYLSGTELLPEPDEDLFKRAVASSKSKAAGDRNYRQVLVHPKGEVPGSKGAPVVSNFADAVNRVESGGTIKVFAGEYEIDEIVIIDRPVTIEPMGGATPVIRNVGQHAFIVAENTDGIVTFKGLTFENSGGHSSIAISGSEAMVTGSNFDALNGVTGVFSGGGAKVTIEESNFQNGAAGTFASGENTELVVRSSTFSGHGSFAVQHQVDAAGLVTGNTMTDCGVWACARAVIGSQVDMFDNHFSDDISDEEVDGFFHHIVIYSGSTGRVSDNLFDGCGHGQCIAGINQSVLEVSSNEFRIYEEQKTRFVIVGSDGTGGNDPHGREVDMTVTDNIITGIGGNFVHDPGNPDAYAIKLGGLLIENLGRMEAHRNTIKNANMGISVLNGGVLVDGQDNKIENVLTAITAFDLYGLGPSFANLRSNDFTDYESAILNDTFDSNSDLTCNWWGTAAGPQNPGGGQSSGALYTPWAAEPVAGSSVTSCTQGI